MCSIYFAPGWRSLFKYRAHSTFSSVWIKVTGWFIPLHTIINTSELFTSAYAFLCTLHTPEQCTHYTRTTHSPEHYTSAHCILSVDIYNLLLVLNYWIMMILRATRYVELWGKCWLLWVCLLVVFLQGILPPTMVREATPNTTVLLLPVTAVFCILLLLLYSCSER